MEENANQSNPREILERICTLAEQLMLEKSKSCRWTSFKDNLCLRYSLGWGWGLVVYDISPGGEMPSLTPCEMSWITPLGSKEPLILGEAFIWRARTEENEMLLEASIGDGSIHLPILGNDNFELPNEALKMILDCMVTNGAMVSFETLELEEIKRRQIARRKELMSDVTAAEKEFGKTSPQANAARRVALQELMKMPKELDAGRLEVPIVSKPFSCIEEMMMHLDMLEAAGESEEEK